MVNIFQNPTKSIPTSDEQIIRVDMEQIDIGGRKSHLLAQQNQQMQALKQQRMQSEQGGAQQPQPGAQAA